MPDANWVSHPEDITHLLNFFYNQRSRIGEGGNWDKTVYNEAAAHMAENHPPKKGGPKTADSIMTKWKALRKLHEHILLAKQKQYPGASGWTYTDECGFNVTDDDQDAWKNFITAHPHFKPFATSGWIHFQKLDDILPSRARGRYVFNARGSQPAFGLSQLSQDKEGDGAQTQADEGNATQTQAANLSQPISDWSQTDFGDDSQPPATGEDSPGSQPASARSGPSQAITIRVPATPVAPTKCPVSDDAEVPWSNKRTRATGPESIMALGRSVEGIGKVIETVFTPKVSSAMSPTKKIAAARQKALEDYEAGYIEGSERTRLNILDWA
ncbi:hypothetical protein C8J57DRAFT_1719857 [Mycena rebaudengoi]|nr:hypothetical protein C8J57DRAFT_1719857 [Mycena rebaudengoi]